jgi:DNA-binding XRE family transcriptional regulator
MNKIKELRILAGLTQVELAVKAGVALGTVISAEKGDDKNKSTLNCIAAALGVVVEELKGE